MKTKVVVVPTLLPVTLAEAKAHLKVLGNDEDADITLKLTAAIEKAEQITNRQLAKATYAGYLDNFSHTMHQLPKPPLVSVIKVEYKDADGNLQQFTDYEVDEISEPSILYFNSLPTDVRADGVNNVIITFECGYVDVPKAIKAWILLYTATLYEHRENLVEGTIVSDAKSEYFNHLLDSFRIIPV